MTTADSTFNAEMRPEPRCVDSTSKIGKPQKPNWSETPHETRVDIIRRLTAQGFTGKQISDTFADTTKMVINRYRLRHCPDASVCIAPVWPEEMESRLRVLWAAGALRSEIAAELGKTEDAIKRKIDRLKLPRRFSAGRKPKLKASGTRHNALAKRPPVTRGVATRPVSKLTAPAIEPFSDEPIVIDAQITDLTWRMCRWPIGDPREPGFHFCAREKTRKSYCEGHARLAYRQREAKLELNRV